MSDIDYDALLADARTEIGRVALAAHADLRGTPEFDGLEDEFRKIETGGPTAVDWKTLNRETLDILGGRSKDLVLASRLVYGLHREEGYRGLALGLTIVQGMVDQHWEAMFPPLARERGRAGAFDWISEKISPLVEAGAPGDDQKIFALVAHDRLVALDKLLGEKLTRFPAALGPLVRALRPHAREARQALEAAAAPPPEVAPVPEPAPQPAAQAPAAAVAASAAMPTSGAQPEQNSAQFKDAASSNSANQVEATHVVIGDNVQQAFDSLSSAALKLAGNIRQQSPAEARAYRLSRFGLWGGLVSAPPDKGGRTSLPPPQRARLSEIQALGAAGNQQGLLLSVESAFATSPFWLDAQRLAFEAMTALGGDYAAARHVVTGELAALLLRLPSLVSLAFADGTPFAEPATIAWISNHVRVGGGGSGEESGADKAIGEAGRLAQSGQVPAALRLLGQHAESRAGERERFVARLDLGEFCLRFELLQPLIALVDGLAELAERRSLEEWEPQLAARLANLSWRALMHPNVKRHLDERNLIDRKSRLLGKLAKLDMASAVELSQS